MVERVRRRGDIAGPFVDNAISSRRGGTLFVVTDDKALEAARARVRLLEQTISELRAQLATRSPSRAGPTADRGAGDRSRRTSLRAPPLRTEPNPAVSELHAALEARRRDLEARTHERDEARAMAAKREAELVAVRAERDSAVAISREREREITMLRRDVDEARAKLHAIEADRDQLRAEVASLDAQIEADRAKAANVKPARRNTAELEAQTMRVQALERQLDALRAAWKSSEERVQAAEAKLKQVRSVDTVAVLRAAADRAGELARLLEGAAVKLDPDDPKVRF
jgi:multidrug resistance efflux pump